MTLEHLRPVRSDALAWVASSRTPSGSFQEPALVEEVNHADAEPETTVADIDEAAAPIGVC